MARSGHGEHARARAARYALAPSDAAERGASCAVQRCPSAAVGAAWLRHAAAVTRTAALPCVHVNCVRRASQVHSRRYERFLRREVTRHCCAPPASALPPCGVMARAHDVIVWGACVQRRCGCASQCASPRRALGRSDARASAAQRLRAGPRCDAVAGAAICGLKTRAPAAAVLCVLTPPCSLAAPRCWISPRRQRLHRPPGRGAPRAPLHRRGRQAAGTRPPVAALRCAAKPLTPHALGRRRCAGRSPGATVPSWSACARSSPPRCPPPRTCLSCLPTRQTHPPWMRSSAAPASC